MTSEAHRALVVADTGSRAMLGAVRALSAAGWRVDIGVPRRSGPALRSRHVHAVHVVSRPEAGARAYAKDVRSALVRGRHEVVFAGSDADALTLSLVREHLGDCALALPSHDACLAAFDKTSLEQQAQAVDLVVPTSWPGTPEALGSVTYPVLVKSKTHWLAGGAGRASRFDAYMAPDRDCATARLGQLRSAGVEGFLQEVVPGYNMSFATVTDGAGRLLARVQHETRATWPLATGATAQAVTVPVDEPLADRVSALLARLNWVGITECEFRVGADGVPRLIDFNGRIYDSIAIAYAAGINLPDIAARVAMDDDPGPASSPVREAVLGRTFQWFEGDLAGALSTDRSLAAAARVVTRAATSAHPVFSRTDPLPTLAQAVNVLSAQARKRRRRH